MAAAGAGTPGRVKGLIESGVLSTAAVRMAVLDEADKLLEDGFAPVINWILSVVTLTL